jgi:Tol biopolymer transport system component
MYIASSNGADGRELVSPQDGMKRNNPVWSEDGEWVYFVAGSEPQDEKDMNVWRVRAAGGSPEQLTDQHAAVNFLAPIDPRTLLYTARDEDGSGPWMWALDIERRAARCAAAGVDRYTSASSRDGRRIVATIANPSATLWRVPLLDRRAEERDAEQYPLPIPAGQSLAPRFGKASLFYLSARGTSDGLWKVQDNTATEVWRNVNGAVFEPPAVSPDGQRLAVVIRQLGKRQLRVMSADGTNPRILAPALDIEGAAFQGTADWSPDGTAIVTGGRDERGPALFIIPAEGGPPARLRDGKFVNPVWSPTGDLIVYAGRSLIGQVTVLGIRPDGGSVELPQIGARPGGYRFLPDGSGLVYLPGIHALDFWLLDSRRWNPVSSRPWAITARSGRSTSPPTVNTSCSTASARTRISCSSIGRPGKRRSRSLN